MDEGAKHVVAAEALDSLRTRGAEIRAKIAANRQRRLAIAAAMKTEAGVEEHEINKRTLAGVAYLDAGKIYSPEGRNIAELYTLAHECGHMFLQRAGSPGYRLSSHVKELEAESYAHQAFRHHGMRVPKHITRRARAYVGSWIEKDREAGIEIDPRVVDFANGVRSPYEPLRDIPTTWRRAGARSLPLPLSLRLRRVLGFLRPIANDPIWQGAQRMGSFAYHHWAFAVAVLLLLQTGYFGSEIARQLLPDLDLDQPTWRRLVALLSYSVVWACCAVLARTMIGRWPLDHRDGPG